MEETNNQSSKEMPHRGSVCIGNDARKHQPLGMTAGQATMMSNTRRVGHGGDRPLSEQQYSVQSYPHAPTDSALIAGHTSNHGHQMSWSQGGHNTNFPSAAGSYTENALGDILAGHHTHGLMSQQQHMLASSHQHYYGSVGHSTFSFPYDYNGGFSEQDIGFSSAARREWDQPNQAFADAGLQEALMRASAWANAPGCSQLEPLSIPELLGKANLNNNAAGSSTMASFANSQATNLFSRSPSQGSAEALPFDNTHQPPSPSRDMSPETNLQHGSPIAENYTLQKQRASLSIAKPQAAPSSEIPSHHGEPGMEARDEGSMDGSAASAPVKQEPPKKKRKLSVRKKVDKYKPRRPLSAYNLFFSEERDRLLDELDGKKRSGDETAQKDEDVASKQPKAYLRPILPAYKKKRKHRKVHGKIGLREMVRIIGKRWKNLPQDRRKYYQELAAQDMQRQRAAMAEYHAKKRQEAAASLPGTAPSQQFQD